MRMIDFFSESTIYFHMRFIIHNMVFLVLFVLVSASPVAALDFGRFSFSLQPKIPTDDGSLSDYSIGVRYTDRISSEIRLNITEKRLNEKFTGIEDSLNVVVNSEMKWFFMPLQFAFTRSEQIHFSAGLGVYYYRQKLDENGYFIMTSLDTPVNAYINNFSMNLVGPIIEAKFAGAFAEKKFSISAEVELAPIAYLNAKQTVDILPLFASNLSNDFSIELSNPFSHSQSYWDALYFHGKLTMSFFNIVDISGIYNGSFHTFDAIDFDSDYNVFVSSKKSYSQNIQIEGSVRIHLDPVDINFGIGGVFSSVYLDSTLTTEGKRLYFVFGGKKSFW